MADKFRLKLSVEPFVDDPALGWEERCKRLENHHYAEVATLRSGVELLESFLDNAAAVIRQMLTFPQCSQCQDHRIAAWHASKTEQPLHEWLRLTLEEYKQWLEKR